MNIDPKLLPLTVSTGSSFVSRLSDDFEEIELDDVQDCVDKIFHASKGNFKDFQAHPLEDRDSRKGTSFEILYTFSDAGKQLNDDDSHLSIKNMVLRDFSSIRKQERDEELDSIIETRDKANAIGRWILEASKHTQDEDFLSLDAEILQNLHSQRTLGQWLWDLIFSSYAQRALALYEKIKVGPMGSTRSSSTTSYYEFY